MAVPGPGAPDRPADVELRLAGVAHDINQMLAVVTGRAGLLQAGETDPARRRHLHAILLAAADAAAMLRRLAPHGAEPVADACDLAAVAAEARLLAWPDRDPNWTWRSQLDDGWSVAVPAQVVREVLVNLVLNAREALGDGGTLDLDVVPGGSGRLVLRVADDGPGLPDEEGCDVFAPGESGSGAPGRGIGLAACRQLLRRHGADLRRGTGAVGACFEVVLPAGTAAAPMSDALVETESVAGTDVLVVDDEIVVREMLRDVLAACGCAVRTARDADAALLFCAERRPEVALVDRNLPGVDGLELASRLRAGDSCLAIFLMSGWQEEGAAQPPASAIDGRVAKPLTLERIQAVVAEGRRLQRGRADGPQ